MEMCLQDKVGNKIREKRKEKRWTTQRLASEIGLCNNGGVSAWENGRAMPNAYSLCLLADALGCSVDELLCRNVEQAMRREQKGEEKQG